VNLKNSGPLRLWLEKAVQTFIDHSPENTLGNPLHEKAFDPPLVGFSNGSDPLYAAFKEHVGLFHWTPAEIFGLTFPAVEFQPEELTVISWVLPQTSATKQDNRKEKVYPAERWARARIFGEEVNVKLRQRVVALLDDNGFPSVAPSLSPLWTIKTTEKFGFASTWSERHAAHVSGLGTFGLCDGLITPKGKAMRAGSVVARIQVPPTPRTYQDHHEYCLFFSQGVCGKCMDRCPAGAITAAGHDKNKCAAHVLTASKEYVKDHYGFEGYGCGLCQTGVPCESKIPTLNDVSD